MAIDGIVPALLTAFGNDGQIDAKGVAKLARYHLDAGASGFFLCGSAGEGIYMTPAERRRIVEIVAAEAAGQASIIAHVGAMSTDEAAMLARDAKSAGATAVATLPPLVFKQPWPAIIEHVRTVAQASELPTYYYHIPVITHVDANAADIAALADAVPGLVGLKFTATDLYLLWEVLQIHNQKLNVLYGCDQQLLQGLITGACGGIGSSYNYQIEHVVELYRAFRRGDHAAAKSAQDKVNRVVQILFKHGGNRSVEKAMMALRGFDVGQPRRPTPPFPAERIGELRHDMQLAGLI